MKHLPEIKIARFKNKEHIKSLVQTLVKLVLYRNDADTNYWKWVVVADLNGIRKNYANNSKAKSLFFFKMMFSKKLITKSFEKENIECTDELIHAIEKVLIHASTDLGRGYMTETDDLSLVFNSLGIV